MKTSIQKINEAYDTLTNPVDVLFEAPVPKFDNPSDLSKYGPEYANLPTDTSMFSNKLLSLDELSPEEQEELFGIIPEEDDDNSAILIALRNILDGNLLTEEEKSVIDHRLDGYGIMGIAHKFNTNIRAIRALEASASQKIYNEMVKQFPGLRTKYDRPGSIATDFLGLARKDVRLTNIVQQTKKFILDRLDSLDADTLRSIAHAIEKHESFKQHKEQLANGAIGEPGLK